jgi:hypothetical protein
MACGAWHAMCRDWTCWGRWNRGEGVGHVSRRKLQSKLLRHVGLLQRLAHQAMGFCALGAGLSFLAGGGGVQLCK